MSSPRVVPLVDSILEEIGVEIVSGTIADGATFTLQSITDRFGVSRTVAREMMRSLEDLSLVEARPRVGITVLAATSWNVFSPRVVAWRLRCQQGAQLRSLTELRVAIEPTAAYHAAVRATPDQRARLVELAAELRQLGEAGHGGGDEFLRADIEFHSLLLLASGNEMFAALGDTVGEILIGRTDLGLQPGYPEREALDRHEALAAAIAGGQPTEAEEHARALVDEVRTALTPSALS